MIDFLIVSKMIPILLAVAAGAAMGWLARRHYYKHEPQILRILHEGDSSDDEEYYYGRPWIK